MKKLRLMRLVKLLREDARNTEGVKFNMDIWAGPSDHPKDGFTANEGLVTPEEEPTVSCGTSACAMGLAVVSKAFEKQGLYAYYRGHYGKVLLEPAIPDKIGGIQTGFDAAKVLFNIKDYEAEYLFSPHRYPEHKRTGADGERYVASRIAKFVREGRVPHGIRHSYQLDERYNYS